jgi:pimeloyl-ACP methyl ester carboxylesterase
MVFPVQLAQRLHQTVPNSRLCIIDAAGHMAQFEQPAPWANAVVEFLS